MTVLFGHVGADGRATDGGDADGVAGLGDLALVVAVREDVVDERLAERDEEQRAPDLRLELVEATVVLLSGG
jgi:hypothetical protein